jgi:hypothetical protein
MLVWPACLLAIADCLAMPHLLHMSVGCVTAAVFFFSTALFVRLCFIGLDICMH